MRHTEASQKKKKIPHFQENKALTELCSETQRYNIYVGAIRVLKMTMIIYIKNLVNKCINKWGNSAQKWRIIRRNQVEILQKKKRLPRI